MSAISVHRTSARGYGKGKCVCIARYPVVEDESRPRGRGSRAEGAMAVLPVSLWRVGGFSLGSARTDRRWGFYVFVVDVLMGI